MLADVLSLSEQTMRWKHALLCKAFASSVCMTGQSLYLCKSRVCVCVCLVSASRARSLNPTPVKIGLLMVMYIDGWDVDTNGLHGPTFDASKILPLELLPTE